MKCFVHQNIDSIDSCKNCYKGVCSECYIDTGNGLACKGNCADKVILLERYLEKAVYKKFNSISIFSLLCGLVFVITGCYEIYLYYFISDSHYGIYIGVFCVCMGAIYLFSFNNALFSKKKKNITSN